MKRSVVVVGAGISGLTAAYRLHRSCAEQGHDIELTVLDAAGRTGGTINSIETGGCLLETGPDSMLSEKPRGRELCEELGLSAELIGTREGSRRSYIARGKSLLPVPEGFYLMAPSRLLPMLASPLFSPLGKLRLLLEPLVPAKRAGGDESLADFVRRRLGHEALERVAQPMVAGIYTADPERLSLAATMPRFLEMERDHGSVLRGMWASARRSEISGAAGPRYSLFQSLASGMGRLISRLCDELPAGTIRTSCTAERAVATASGWKVECRNATTVEADGLCIALRAPDAGRLLASANEGLSRELCAIEYASTATVNLVYDRRRTAGLPEAAGFVVPAIEGRTLLACTFADQKFEGRAAADKTVIRAFVGGGLSEESLELPDQQMVDAVRHDLAELTGLDAVPLHTVIERHRDAMPQYQMGHLERVSRIEAATDGIPALGLAGNYFQGPGIPDCIERAEKTACGLFQELFGTTG